MTGAQLAKFLADVGQRTPLDQVAITVQQGEGECKEVMGMRVVTEMGAENQKEEIVLRTPGMKRANGKSEREAVGDAKKQAEGGKGTPEPVKKGLPL